MPKLKLSKRKKRLLDEALQQALKSTEKSRKSYEESARIPWWMWFERMTI